LTKRANFKGPETQKNGFMLNISLWSLLSTVLKLNAKGTIDNVLPPYFIKKMAVKF